MEGKIIANNQLFPAEVIIAKKRTGFWRILKHYIVYVGNYTFIGNIESSVRVLTQADLKELLKTYEPVGIKSFRGSSIERYRALQRAYSRLGQKYSYLRFNCEHFANWVQTGKENSPQVATGILLVTSAIALKMIWNHEE